MRIFIITLLILTISPFGHAKDKVNVGDVPPDFIGRTLNGEKIKLSDMRGKIVVVTFWATWCGPCLAELPVLNALQKQVSSDRLQVVAINFGESIKAVKFIKNQLPDTNILFTRDPRKYSSKKYGVVGIPHMVIVDHMGNVAHIHIGYGDGTEERLVGELNALLAVAPRVINNPVVTKKAS